MVALSKAINEVLIPAGFSKDGDVWRRASVPWLDVMELQKSKSGQAATLNCGIHHPEIYEKCWGRPGKTPISYSNCIVRTRLSELVLGRDEWWKLEDPVAIEAAAEMTKSHGLPFVERMHSLERVHDFFQSTNILKKRYPPDIIYLSAIKSQLGDSASARKIMEALEMAVPPSWKRQVLEALNRIGR